jgi:EmrB/QacA subfamily drug resistance transporter
MLQTQTYVFKLGKSMTQHQHSTSVGDQVYPQDWLALAALALAQFMLILDVTVINVALPDLSRDLGLSAEAAGWTIAAYAVPFGGLMLLGGRSADIFGSRRVFLIGLALFTSSSLAAGIAPNASTLIAARVLQGVGAALLSPAALATLTTRFTGRNRHRALGVWAAIGGIGAAAGVLLGGLLTDGPGWRWIFYINVPVGVLVAIVVPLLVPAVSANSAKRRLDVVGGAIVTLAMASLTYGIMNAGPGAELMAWLPPLLVAIGLLIAFVVVERRAAEPLIDLSVFGRQPIRAGIFVMLLASALLIGGFFLLSFVLQGRMLWSPLTTGLAFLPVALGTLVGAHLGGTFVSRVGGRAVAGVAFVVAAAGFGIAALQLDTAALLIAGVSIAAFGLGAAFVASTTTALSHVAHHEAGVISGLINTFHEVGGALGVAAMSALAASSLVAPRLDAGFALGLAVWAVVALGAAAVATLLVPPGKPAADAPRFAH